MIKINNLKQTTIACPAQWEFYTFDNRPVYVRYRWGALSIYIGSPDGSMYETYDGKIIFYEEIGNNADGFIEWEHVEKELNKLTKEKVLTMIRDNN